MATSTKPFVLMNVLQRFIASEAFAAHRDKLTPLLERSKPTRYELVYEKGDV